TAAMIGIVLGLLPALRMRRAELTQALGDGAAGAIPGPRTRGRMWIITAQIAIAAMLLVVAMLLGRSFAAMLNQDRGFDANHALTARLTLPDFAFTPAMRVTIAEDLMARASSLPGAPLLAVTTGLPLSGSENITGFNMPSPRPEGGTIN